VTFPLNSEALLAHRHRNLSLKSTRLVKYYLSYVYFVYLKTNRITCTVCVIHTILCPTSIQSAKNEFHLARQGQRFAVVTEPRMIVHPLMIFASYNPCCWKLFLWWWRRWRLQLRRLCERPRRWRKSCWASYLRI
jgi:hypothetical protein